MSTRMAKWSSLHKAITYLSIYLPTHMHAYMCTYIHAYMCISVLLCVLHVMRVIDLAQLTDPVQPT